MKKELDRQNKAEYRIGAVSKLTGVPSDTLRVWERRYGGVKPSRSGGGGRLYTEQDINRLSLIKKLVDAGHAIGTVANLSLEELNTRLAAVAGIPTETRESEAARVIIVGLTLAASFADQKGSSLDMDLLGSFATLEAYQDSSIEQQPDVIILEYTTLHESDLSEIGRLYRQSKAARCVVVYGYGSRTAVKQLEQNGVTVLQSPVSVSEISRICREFMLLGARAKNHQNADVLMQQHLPPRIYSRAQLARFATISTAVKCECPQHLADIILNLDAFEVYSMECENLNEEDAAIHAYLHAATAQARSIMEHALKRVVHAEGLDESIQTAGE